MNAILKGAIEQFEKLSPEDQEKLAREIEQRAYDMWLDAELQKGVDSLEKEGGHRRRMSLTGCDGI